MLGRQQEREGRVRPLNLSKLIEASDIQNRVEELGQEITQKFKGESLVVVSHMKHSTMFFADLVRSIDLDLDCQFIHTTSYNRSTLSGQVQVGLDLTLPIEGENVLLVTGLIDKGSTTHFLMKTLEARRPKKLSLASLLLKPAALKVECPVDYLGFSIENHFVVGYGLGYGDYYKNLPYIAQAQNLN